MDKEYQVLSLDFIKDITRQYIFGEPLALVVASLKKMDTTPTQTNIWPNEDKSYKIWPPMGSEVAPVYTQSLNLLRSTLEARLATVEARVDRILDDIRFILGTKVEVNGELGPAYDARFFWDAFFAAVHTLPSNHLYSDILLRVVDFLLKASKEVDRDIDIAPFSINNIYDNLARGIEIQGGHFDDDNPEARKIHWRNFSSFVARLVGKGNYDSYHDTVLEMRRTLEREHSTIYDVKLIKNKVWVASEYIVHAGRFLYIVLTTQDDTYDSSCETYSLCSELPPFGLERWEFWQKRFIEFAADAEIWQLDNDMVVRLAAVVNHMDTIRQEEI